MVVEVDIADRAQLKVQRFDLELEALSFGLALAKRVGEGPARLPKHVRLVLGVPKLPLRLA
jgi:hypothetical protein